MRFLNLHKLSGGVFAFLLMSGTASRAEAAPFFEEAPNALGTQPCNGGGCWTNYLRVTDIDGDKDLDIVVPNASGFFNKGANAEPLVIYQNNGSAAFTDISATSVGGYANWIRQVAIGDINNDGFPDMYVPTAWNDPNKFFINDGKGVFTDEAAKRLPGVSSHSGAARFGDIDNDGDLDLLVADAYANNAAFVAHLYVNDGTGVFKEDSGKLPTMKKGEGPDDFDLFDADGDFDLDLLINMHESTSSLWINDGTGTFTDAPFVAQNSGAYKYDPVACDVDGDNDLDLWFDNEGANYTEQLLINDGTGKFTDQTAARVTGNPSADDNGVACIDVDGDGFLDAAIMSLSKNERVLKNDGTGKFTLIPDAFPTVKDPTLWFEFGDLNGDGRLDVVTGQGEGSPALERVYLGTMTAPVDVNPPKFRAVETILDAKAGDAPVVRFAVVDNATTDEGPRLQKAFVKVTTVNSTVDIPAAFMGGDLFRAVIPEQKPGLVTYTACAVDQQGNSGCSDSKMYTVTGDASSSSSTGVGGSAAGSGGAGGAGGGGSVGASSTSGGDGAGGSDGPDLDESDSGCGCAVPGREGGAAWAAAGVGLLAALALHRRRRSSSRPRG